MQDLRILLVQRDTSWHDPETNRRQLDELLAQAEPIHLVVLPEMFTTGFTMDAEGHAENMNDATMGWLTEQAQRAGAALCGSLIVEAEGRYFNRFVFMRPNGDFDLYVVIGDPQEGGGWAVRTFIKPYANWIWAGSLIMALGGLISLFDRRLRVGAPTTAAKHRPAGGHPARAGQQPADPQRRPSGIAASQPAL